jgi:hypothetical protein
MKAFSREKWSKKRAAAPLEPGAVRVRGEDDVAVRMLLSGVVLEAILNSLRVVCAIG